MKFEIIKESPLLIRLILLMAPLTLLLAVVLAAAELTLSYNRGISELKQSIETLRQTQLSSLGENLWQFDSRAVEIQLQSIKENQAITALVLTDDKSTVYTAGDTSADYSILHTLPIVKHLDGGEEDTIGTLKIFSSDEDLRKDIAAQIPVVICIELAKLLSSSLIMLILFYNFFHRHLNKIAAFTNTLNVSNIRNTLRLNRRRQKKEDELDRLVNAVNNCGIRIADGIEQIHTAEEALRTSEEMYRQVYNAPDDAILIHDNSGLILDVNAAASEMYGYDPAEFHKLSIIDISSESEPYTFAKLTELIHEALAGGTPKFEWRAKRKSGELFWVSVNLRKAFIGNVDCVIAFVHDITEQNRLEENLRQSQKMEAIGTLAGGIAHDFNNILSGIIGYSELAQAELESAENAIPHEYIGEILKASDRAKGLVEQILLFSRKSGKEKKIIEAAELISESMKLLRSSIPSTIEFNIIINSTAKISADATQIHQIVMNLCTNAYHAMMEHGGVLTTELSDLTISKSHQAEGTRLEPGKYVHLAISDTGCGMPEEIRKRIFDPYFTTKKEGEGTGLGLSMVHGIVKDHGGEIAVFSEVGKGTVFSIYIPAVSSAEPANDAPASAEKNVTGSESILFADDETVIRQLARKAFINRGYAVTLCRNGQEAWDLYRSNPEGYDIIISDVTMPIMTGIELTRMVRSVSREIPIILCSGFTVHVTDEFLKEEQVFRFLQKPLLLSQLQTVVREALDSRRSGRTQADL